jgi:sterol desaturase/sphingolipid hydroxylase (fatty acid hydroxylase superfamily)
MLFAAVQILAIGAFLAAGQIAPRRAQPALSADLGVDLATGATLAVAKWTVLALPLAAIASYHGWIPMGRLPGWAQWIACFLVLDFSRYALHRAHHRVPWLWTFHRVHHSSERIESTSGLRMHVVDFLQLALLPVILFGLVFDVSAQPAWFVPSLMVPGVLFDAFEHSNLRFSSASGPGWFWDKVLNNPHFHAWHHTAEGATRDGNYGNVLTVWDRLFGSCVSGDGLPERFGLDDASRLVNDPLSLQLLRPRGPVNRAL